MNIRQLHHLWTQLRAVRPWFFLVLALVCAMVAVTALRSNYQHMSKLRDAVYAADKNGTNVQVPLQNLRQYVYAHMNTNLASSNTTIYPPIQLKYTYERLTAAANQQNGTANSQLYTQAQTYCQQVDSSDFSGRNRVPCIQNYVSTHGAKTSAVVSPSLYQFDFVSPRWSPDLAGWSLVATIVCVFMWAGLWLIEKLIRKRVN